MTELRRLLQDYAVFLVLLSASVGGHYWFVFVHRKPPPLVLHVPISDVQGVTRVAIQIVAARPKPTLEVPEPVVAVKPIETPEPLPLEIAKVELPPEKIITTDVPRPNAPPAPPPPPPVEKVDEEEMPPEEKPPEPPRKRRPKLAEVQNQPEIKSENDVTAYQDATRGSDVKVTASYQPFPVYPLNLYNQKIEGDVDLVVKLDETGKVIAVSVLRSSGKIEFDQSAVDVVSRSWRFNPPLDADGRPVAHEVKVPILFSYDRSRKKQ
jgi:protein TonB